MACWQVLCSVSVRVIAIFISWRFAPFCAGCHDCGRKSTVCFFFSGWVDGWGWMGFYSELIFNENPPSNFGISLKVLFGGSNKHFQLPTSLEGWRMPKDSDFTFFHDAFEAEHFANCMWLWFISSILQNNSQSIKLAGFLKKAFQNHSINKIVVCVKNLGLSLPVGKWRLKGITKKHNMTDMTMSWLNSDFFTSLMYTYL